MSNYQYTTGPRIEEPESPTIQTTNPQFCPLLGLLPLMCSNHQWMAPSIDKCSSWSWSCTNDVQTTKCQSLVATIVEDELELVATIVDKRAREAVMDAYK